MDIVSISRVVVVFEIFVQHLLDDDLVLMILMDSFGIWALSVSHMY